MKYRSFLFAAILFCMALSACNGTPTPTLPFTRPVTLPGPSIIPHINVGPLPNQVVFDIDHYDPTHNGGLFLVSGNEFKSICILDDQKYSPPFDGIRCQQILEGVISLHDTAQYLELNIDDDFLFEGNPTSSVKVEIIYYDSGTDRLYIEYDANSNGYKTDSIEKTDSRKWKTATFKLDDVYFGKNDNDDEADIRIYEGDDGNEVIYRVTVTLGNTIMVTTELDNGNNDGNDDDPHHCSLRCALNKAQPYDTITFDPEVFPPEYPVAIMITSPLPWMDKGRVTIDASNAGVILDGSGVPGEDWNSGISINSESNTIQGLHIVNFNGAGIELYDIASHNIIGGDPQNGSGPLGQGNLCSGNLFGILLAEVRDNTITGNQIGVEINGIQGNHENGVLLREVGSGNVIGPNNTIVYSGQQGIFILDPEAESTTITRNRIYSNAVESHFFEINYHPRSASTPTHPTILSFDLVAGTANGITCAGCKVELFSGKDGGATYFEGSVTAGPQGYFTFTSNSSLAGPNLVATSTRPDGSTSVFSYPTTGESWSGVLQEGNRFPVQAFNALASEEISDDNRIGTHTFLPYCEDIDFLQRFNGLGFKRVRLTFNEMEYPYDLKVAEIPNWADFEPCIDFFLSRGMKISYILSFWDKEAQLAGEEVPIERFTNVGEGDPETERYRAFLGSMVPNLKEHGIHLYEIWDEPDNFAPTQGIASQNYINLVALIVQDIKGMDQDARVLVGGVSGTHNPDPAAYLLNIVDSDLIMPLVDGVSWHPFYGPSPAYPEVAGYYNTYPNFVREIQATAYYSGFTGEFIADELTWRTPLNYTPDQPYRYPEIVAAKYYARGILTNLGLDVSTGADVGTFMPFIYSTVRNLSTVMAGNAPGSLDVKMINSESDNLMYYNFDLSNGEQLFAIWTNGAAVEYDPGVSATLSFSFADDLPGSVEGIDVLQGYTQQLNTEVDDNLLIIHDLWVKDYPLIIKFKNASQ